MMICDSGLLLWATLYSVIRILYANNIIIAVTV